MTKKSHSLYSMWKGMRNRCNNPNYRAYHRYGGRGIKVCNRWDDFWAFVRDMGERPEGFTIDRKDNDGDYEPSNCKWSSYSEQMNNKYNNHVIRYNGEEKTLMCWSKFLGFDYHRVKALIYKGYSMVEAINHVSDDKRRFFKGKLLSIPEIMRQEKCELDYSLVINRICRGWDVERAIKTPKKRILK